MSKTAFLKTLRVLIPELRSDDIVPAGAGVRAMAVARDGTLVDDFRIEQSGRMVHVLNAPSPAATASLSIGRTVAELAAAQFGL
jgi:L-2-hydroxyglutarate oxidase